MQTLLWKVWEAELLKFYSRTALMLDFNTQMEMAQMHFLGTVAGKSQLQCKYMKCT
jgi:hypothetical protein